MNNAFAVPEDLQKHVASIDDNRKPGDEIVIDAQTFVLFFRDDLEQWLDQRLAATSKQMLSNKSV